MSTKESNEYQSVPFSTKVETENHKKEKIPLAAGEFVDFKLVCDDEDVYCAEKRQKCLLNALDKQKITQRPCMVIDLAPLRDLELVLDGNDWIESEESKKETRPECAKIVVPASQVVDIAHLTPRMGNSIVRCNPAFPAYRWFQAMNLLLHYQGKTAGRVIPFPLQVQSENKNQPTEHMYHVLRVTKPEYIEYQKLLAQAVNQDGVEKGFFHAAKYGYEVLFKRGHKEITAQVVGDAVTSVILMGQPVIRGVLIGGSKEDDFDDELAKSHFIYN